MMRTSWTVAAGAMICVACTAGLPPRPKPVQLADAVPLQGFATAGGGEWPAEHWWQRYRDPTLDRLIELATDSSPTLATAHARYDSARQSVRLAGAASGVRMDASADIDRQRLSDNGLVPPTLLGFHWYNQADLGLQASYTFDWWGKQRAAVEAAMDQAHAAQADRSAAALLLASSVADTYFGWQADQSRLSLARARADAVLREGAIAAARVKAELDSADELDRYALAAADAQEQVAMLQGSATLRLIALAALAGKPLAELPPLQAKALPTVPDNLPDDVRIDLISRRADITASRWRVEAAQKDLDAARAEFFPDITINALAGLSSIDLGKLLNYGSRIPQASAALHLPIFDSGRLEARYGASQASVDAAVASYRDTLVSAARDVATQASTRAQIAAQRSQRLIEVDAAQRLQTSASARVRQGIIDSRTELTATEALLQQRDALLQLDAAAVAADIALQRALGGGYLSAQKLAASASPSTKASPSPTAIP
ncbi:MAG: efflux transporter outer membrane subunit [Pseudomonadota bacterium]|nr:efflux transporter outer membrane subunit [Pseudomonadota bacterium]